MTLAVLAVIALVVITGVRIWVQYFMAGDDGLDQRFWGRPPTRWQRLKRFR